MSEQLEIPLGVGEPVRGGDRVREVFETSYRRLVGQLYGVCADLSEAEEVVAEAFARAVQHQRTFARLDNPEAWLRTVAVNVSRTRFRRGLRSVSSEREPAHPPEMTEERLALMAAMRQLPAPQREALALHYLADLPVHQVAAATGAAVGTVKSRLSRGRTALAALLADLPDSREEAAHG